MGQNYGLGRGLSSLIPQKKINRDDKENNFDFQKKDEGNTGADLRMENSINNRENFNQGVLEVDIEKILANPYQPRIHFDEDKLRELADSIKEHGILQPLVVTKKGDGYELIAGERRLQASKLAMLLKVPIIIKDVKDNQKLELAIVENIQRHNLNPVEEARSFQQLMERRLQASKLAMLSKVPIIIKDVKDNQKLELAIVENIQRHNLNPVEEARSFQQLMDEFKMSQEDVAKKLGKSRSVVANKVRLLKLPIEAIRALKDSIITEGHAKAILSLENPEKQRALLDLIIKNHWTVRQTESKTKEITSKPYKRLSSIDPEIKELEDKLAMVMGTKVKVTKSGGEGGKIIIDYYSSDELNKIINNLSTEKPEEIIPSMDEVAFNEIEIERDKVEEEGVDEKVILGG